MPTPEFVGIRVIVVTVAVGGVPSRLRHHLRSRLVRRYCVSMCFEISAPTELSRRGESHVGALHPTGLIRRRAGRVGLSGCCRYRRIQGFVLFMCPIVPPIPSLGCPTRETLTRERTNPRDEWMDATCHTGFQSPGERRIGCPV